MSASIDTALTDCVTAILADITATEAARVPVDAEVQAEAARLDALAAKAADAPPGQWWLSPSPNFNAVAFNDAVTAALMQVAPEPTRKAMIERVKQRASTWKGLRLAPAERERKLTKLQAELRIVRAKIELQRRAAEEISGIMLPRLAPLDSPEIWLMVPDALNALAATSNGRTR